MFRDGFNPFCCVLVRVWDRWSLQPSPDTRIIQNWRKTRCIGETWRSNNDIFIGRGKTEKRFPCCRIDLEGV